MSTTKTSIEWTDRTWGPVRGCSRVSDGCRNCYAERLAGRFSGPGLAFEGFAKHVITDHTPGEETREARWTGRVELVPDALDAPLRWRKPRRIFVNSMSDLFHEALPDESIDRVFAVMALAPWHTFQVLTKRPERMRAYLSGLTFERILPWMNRSADGGDHRHGAYNLTSVAHPALRANGLVGHRVGSPPFPNVWLGVSCEDQRTADERIPLLLQTQAAVRFVSYEPALGPVDFKPGRFLPPGEPYRDAGPFIDWLIVGGESGHGARPFGVRWARSVVAQCRAACVPVFVKQLGSNVSWDVDIASGNYERTRFPKMDRDLTKRADGTYRVHLKSSKGGDPAEWPEDLRIREFPKVAV